MSANPGSDAAIAAGCICAVLDNNRGRFPVFEAYGDQPAGWWITEGCPIHSDVKTLP